MNAKNKTLSEVQSELIRNFDFETVHKTMTYLDWVWFGCNGVPSIFDLIKKSRSLIKHMYNESENGYVYTGGLKVTRFFDEIHLEFCVSHSEIKIYKNEY